MVETSTPTWRTVSPTVALAALVVATTGPVAVAGLIAVVAGAVVIGGVYRGSRSLLGIGITIQFLAMLFAAIGALRIEFVVLSALGIVLCWDVGEQAITVAEQLRSPGAGTRPLVVHTAGTLLAGMFIFGGVYGLYLVAGGGQPVVALVLLLSGSGFVLAGMRL